MIGYQTVGTNKLEKAAAFYDKLLGKIGGQRTMEEVDKFVYWSASPDKPGFCVHVPYNGKKASIGNGSMTAFQVDTPKMVDELYALAMKLGASDEGPAGARGGGFYAGFCRDLDGNKFNFFCMTEA
jgi:catechol 2,3-dioxygenase-like lactoylglutathione lyase family enzyme